MPRASRDVHPFIQKQNEEYEILMATKKPAPVQTGTGQEASKNRKSIRFSSLDRPHGPVFDDGDAQRNRTKSGESVMLLLVSRPH